MRLEDVSRPIEAIDDWLRSRDQGRGADDSDARSKRERSSAASGITVEEVRAAEEGWRRRNDRSAERRPDTGRSEWAGCPSEVSQLYRLDGPLLATIDLVPLLKEVLVGVASLLGAEAGAVRLLDGDGQELETVVSLGLSPACLEAFGRTPIGAGPCGLAVAGRGPVIVEDVASDPIAGSLTDAARSDGYRGAFSIPLIAGGRGVMGTVAILFRERHRPSQRQVHLVEQYVLRASGAIANALGHRAVRESDRRKEELFAALAHELRGPLAAIRDWAQLLGPDADLAEAAGEAREVIIRQAGIMSRLVDDLLDAARMCRGVLALRKEPVDVATLVARTAADLRPLIESRGQQLEVALPDGPTWIEADPTRLGQILTNLLTNAAKYTDPGGRIDLIATNDREAGEIILRVRDTGIGLAPEALSQIFELFAQAVPMRDRARGGLGIGLALVRTLVELHGGTVSASSPGPGRGSEFIVRLPTEGRIEPGASPRRPTPEGWADPRATPPVERGRVRDGRTEAA